MNRNQDEQQQYNTVEPRFIEGQRERQNLFAITRFRHDRGFHIFYYYWGKENSPTTALNRGSLTRGFTLTSSIQSILTVHTVSPYCTIS